MVLAWDDRDTSTPPSTSVGELLPNCEGKIMNESGINEVRPGEKGEFWCRGPNIMKGYWRNPKATADTLTRDGWLKTGDIAYVDEHDKVFIVDRKKVCGIGDGEEAQQKADTIPRPGIDQSQRQSSRASRARGASSRASAHC
jgi:acyl-CoA synthetase (AMP-forming)/AMP-acid ligase II